MINLTMSRDHAEALDAALGRVIDEYTDDLKDSIFDDEELAERAEQLKKIEAVRLNLTQTLWPQSCGDCGAQVPSIIGCPDGAEICQACFDAGNH